VSSRPKMKPLKWYDGEAKTYSRDHVSSLPLYAQAPLTALLDCSALCKCRLLWMQCT
jgi:hypothetical protein